ncbi:efflux RND transporter periplasmic adaptor subunit [Aliiruegeria sabulilitoris]|uniref:efflux RND transporter periplasmic adaptor subunit n=1 Tax=Aliiruegeria sabulilitoris TaxID=1510458 RepID=UPI0008364066|nr:efflux RND transporter periplasmic adaptor subunit [Aliiruegeria sabulilitoris]NDR55828.1 efflux RND transporter periplasmic adaptor subunit [Pseudoruegeria sp. M32A2M]
MTTRIPFATFLVSAALAIVSPAAIAAVPMEGGPSFNTLLENLSFDGRVEVKERAVVSNSVNGLLSRVLFNMGGQVEAGQPLFEIADSAYQFKLQTAEVNVARRQVDLDAAVAALSRASALHERGNTSATARADAENAVKLATANLLEAEATLDLAKIQLAATAVRAPIAGHIDGVNYPTGSYLKADTGVILSQVTQLDPVLVSFHHPYTSLLELYAAAPDRLGNLLDAVSVEVTLPTGEQISETGRIIATANALSAEDSTLAIWAEVPNPETLLIPGLPVTVGISVIK